MSMSKRSMTVVAVLGLVVAAAAVAATTASAQQSGDKRWLAVAPGRVEPPSGILKVAAPAMGIVSKVMVKVNDTEIGRAHV